jgi:AcrR family transcriptional regulator
MPREGRRERKKRELRRRIYEAARQLFLEHGVASTTVEQIAEAADVSHTTFFNHFHSKGELLREMTGEVSERLEAMLGEQLDRESSTRDRLASFAESVALGIGQAEGLARDVLLELMRTGQAGEALPYLAGVYEPFTAILRQGQMAGDVRGDVEPRVLAEALIGTLHMALVGWLNQPEYPFKERLGQFTQLIVELIEPR